MLPLHKAVESLNEIRKRCTLWKRRGARQILVYNIKSFELIFIFNLNFKIILAFGAMTSFVVQAAMEAKLLLIPFPELWDDR